MATTYRFGHTGSAAAEPLPNIMPDNPDSATAAAAAATLFNRILLQFKPAQHGHPDHFR
jgi:hypothetical protein